MNKIDLTRPKGAIFTEDGKHRFALWRIWSVRKPLLMFIGLNPSKANQITDDPTITRLIKRAAITGFGGLLGANLFTLVSTDPGALLVEPDVIIPDYSDYYIEEMIKLSSIQLCAWGSFTAVKMRAPSVYKKLKNPHCLGINADGEPMHPLYVSYEKPLVKYERMALINER